MAVTTVNKVRVVESATSSVNQDTYEVLYQVTVNDKDTPLSQVLTAAGIPALGSEFDEIPGNFCTDVKGVLVGSTRLKWEVTVTFNNKPLTIYTWGTKTLRRTLTDGKGAGVGKQITNSAGEMFSPALTTDLHMLTLKVEREESRASFSPYAIQGYTNTVNSDLYIIDPTGSPYNMLPYTALMSGISAVYNPSKFVWKVTYDIVIRDYDPTWVISKPLAIPTTQNAWVRRVIDAGLREVVDGELRPITDKISGTATTKALPLDGNGQWIQSDGSYSTEPVWLGFVEYNSLDWSVLAL
jgi:hypothetical protein